MTFALLCVLQFFFCFSFAHNAFSAPLWKAMDAYQVVCLHYALRSFALSSFFSSPPFFLFRFFGSVTFSIAPSENVSASFFLVAQSPINQIVFAGSRQSPRLTFEIYFCHKKENQMPPTMARNKWISFFALFFFGTHQHELWTMLVLFLFSTVCVGTEFGPFGCKAIALETVRS